MSYPEPHDEPIEALPLDERPADQKGKGGCWKGCLFGCLGIFVVGVVAAVIAGWYIYRHGPGMAANLARVGAQQALDDTELPQEEKDAILAQLDRLVTAANDGRVTWEKLGTAIESMQGSALFAAWVVYAAETKYLQPSGLSDEEKRDATRVLQRILHGLHDKSISQDQLEPLMAWIVVDDGPGKKTLKEQLTDDELRKFLADCRQIADDAAVPDEPFEITISQELKQVVDKVLGEAPPTTEP